MADAEEHSNIPRRIVEELVDVLVYAPVGLASTVIEELPGLVEKGRSRLMVARTIGQFAVVMGRQRIGQAVSERTKKPASEPKEGPPGRKAEPEAAPGSDEHSPAPARTDGGRDDADDAHEHDGRRDGSGGLGAGADPSGLAIPGYDSLAASQVVQRLAGLSPEELDAVRRYEESTRGRRTILGRISQLSSGRGEPESE